ncbi:MAG: hypothetical protein ACKVJU_22005 [Verrucomicrobiales bacterium]
MGKSFQFSVFGFQFSVFVLLFVTSSSFVNASPLTFTLKPSDFEKQGLKIDVQEKTGQLYVSVSWTPKEPQEDSTLVSLAVYEKGTKASEMSTNEPGLISYTPSSEIDAEGTHNFYFQIGEKFADFSKLKLLESHDRHFSIHLECLHSLAESKN